MSRMWDRDNQRYWILCGKEWLVMRIFDDKPVCTWPAHYQDQEVQYDVCFARDDRQAAEVSKKAFEFVKADIAKDPGVAYLCMAGPGGKVVDIGNFKIFTEEDLPSVEEE